MTKTYCIGGHLLSVTLEEPWIFKPLTPKQESLVALLASGGDAGVIPVPADKIADLGLNRDIMDKDAMTREKWEGMTNEERRLYRKTLDMIQYAPFEVAADFAEGAVPSTSLRDRVPVNVPGTAPSATASSPLMRLTVSDKAPEWLADRSGWKQVVAVDEILPFYYGYRVGERTVYEFFPREGFRAGYFVMEPDHCTGTYYPSPKAGSETTQMQVNTSLMILFTFATAPLKTVLLHSSVIRYEGKGALFFGVSGTGKSTHARLWLENVPGCDLMNDDNPIIRVTPEGIIVYGSPWSGKTLCYRNVFAPVRALVRLDQSPVNEIERLDGLEAYASVIAAVSTIRWDSSVMDDLIPTIEALAMGVPCYHLGCRPDADAVLVCREGIMQQG